MNAIRMTPDIGDAWAALGCLFASFLTAVYGIQAKRTGWQIITQIASASFVGFLAPGIIIYRLPYGWSDSLSFHHWAAAGFVSGLLGMGIPEALILWREQRLRKWIFRGLDKATGEGEAERKAAERAEASKTD